MASPELSVSEMDAVAAVEFLISLAFDHIARDFAVAGLGGVFAGLLLGHQVLPASLLELPKPAFSSETPKKMPITRAAIKALIESREFRP